MLLWKRGRVPRGFSSHEYISYFVLSTPGGGRVRRASHIELNLPCSPTTCEMGFE
jgi:hypothetical protein